VESPRGNKNGFDFEKCDFRSLATNPILHLHQDWVATSLQHFPGAAFLKFPVADRKERVAEIRGQLWHHNRRSKYFWPKHVTQVRYLWTYSFEIFVFLNPECTTWQSCDAASWQGSEFFMRWSVKAKRWWAAHMAARLLPNCSQHVRGREKVLPDRGERETYTRYDHFLEIKPVAITWY